MSSNSTINLQDAAYFAKLAYATPSYSDAIIWGALQGGVAAQAAYALQDAGS